MNPLRYDDPRHADQEPKRSRSSALWLACDLRTWCRRLIENRFDVDRGFLPWLPLITLMSLELQFLGRMQRVFFKRKIARTKIEKPPLFVIGHWRTGTTLLHELLTLDDRHAFPTGYQCIAPKHFLVSERLAMRWFSRFVPSRRPMDNMPFGWERPQEDEFALVAMGLPSPYLTITFPNRPPQYTEYLDLESVPEKAREHWKRQYLNFLKAVTYRDPRRLVLKSPTHTFRVKVLLEMFPDAQFVHIVRDPYRVFASTIHLWKTLYHLHGLHRPTFEGLEDYVLDTFLHMHRKLDEARAVLAPGQFHELRYEDLVRDPVGELRQLYERLEIGSFDAAKPAVEAYLAAASNYQTNQFELTDRQLARIADRWGDWIERYGYARKSTASPLT